MKGDKMVIPQGQFKWYITKTDFSNGTSEFYVIFSNKESVVKKDIITMRVYVYDVAELKKRKVLIYKNHIRYNWGFMNFRFS
jgi:hypothetical protein